MSPKSQERIFPRAYSAELLRIARGDHNSASFLLSGLATEGVRPENVAYLFQQAIEKALKAALCALRSAAADHRHSGQRHALWGRKRKSASMPVGAPGPGFFPRSTRSIRWCVRSAAPR